MMNKTPSLETLKIAEIEISYRNLTPYHERLKVPDSTTAYKIFNAIWDMDKMELAEQFKIMLLDSDNHCLGIAHFTTGTINRVLVDLRVVFATVIKSNAQAFYLAHNHPNGNYHPSKKDVSLTRKVVRVAKLLNIHVRDHLILTTHGCFSFSQNKIMPE